MTIIPIIPIILIALVVLAAMVSLVVPDLHRRYAGGLWTATLLTSIIASVAFIGLVGLGD